MRYAFDVVVFKVEKNSWGKSRFITNRYAREHFLGLTSNYVSKVNNETSRQIIFLRSKKSSVIFQKCDIFFVFNCPIEIVDFNVFRPSRTPHQVKIFLANIYRRSPNKSKNCKGRLIMISMVCTTPQNWSCFFFHFPPLLHVLLPVAQVSRRRWWLW